MTRRALLAATGVREVPGTGHATGAYCSELADFWRALTDAGWAVEVATPPGGPVPLEAVDPDDAAQAAMLDDPAMRARLDDAPALAGARGPFGLVAVIGGHGAVWDLADDAELAGLLAEAHAAGGTVAAVCHGVAGLLAGPGGGRAPLVAGRRVAAFTEAEERAVGMASAVPFLLGAEVERRGGEHVAGGSFLPHVVSDGRVVTGQNPASAAATARAAIESAQRRPERRAGAAAAP